MPTTLVNSTSTIAPWFSQGSQGTTFTPNKERGRGGGIVKFPVRRGRGRDGAMFSSSPRYSQSSVNK